MNIFYKNCYIQNRWVDNNDIPIFDIDEIDLSLKKYKGSKNTKLKKYLNNRYANKLLNVANLYDAYFDKKSSGEYAYPAKRRKVSIDCRNAKMQVSKDLESIFKNAIYLTTGNYKQNDDRLFDIFKTIFGIKNKDGKIQYYIADINIQIINNCYARFYDITKIKKK